MFYCLMISFRAYLARPVTKMKIIFPGKNLGSFEYHKNFQYQSTQLVSYTGRRRYNYIYCLYCLLQKPGAKQ